ncbi:MAG: hypothetical protein AABY22_12645, partial [Nanoarchaeota archaeon]
MSKKLNLIGSWAFLVGVILAVVAGIATGLDLYDLTTAPMTITLVIIGLIVGLLNVKGGESMPFLFSGLALIIASVFGAGITSSVPVVSSTLASLLVIFVPATIVVAI